LRLAGNLGSTDSTRRGTCGNTLPGPSAVRVPLGSNEGFSGGIRRMGQPSSSYQLRAASTRTRAISTPGHDFELVNRLILGRDVNPHGQPQSLTHRAGHGAGSSGDVQFLENVFHVRSSRTCGDPEASGDLCIGAAVD
jgi:hypothetical protein